MESGNNKKKYVALLFLVFAVVTVTIGASFAFFNYSREGVVNVLQMGNIEFAMLDGDNVLITNAFPQSDDEGNLNEAYSFTVKNTSSEGFDIYYNLLFLDNNKESDVNYFSNGQIKYSLVKNGVYAAKTSSTSGNKLSSINGFTIGGTTGEGVVLSKQLIKAGETDSYNLRIWISDDVDYSTEESNGLVTGAFNEYMYSLKVKIETTSGEVEYDAGLYNADDDIVYDWDELKSKGYVIVTDGALTTDNSFRDEFNSGNFKLVVGNDVTSISNQAFIGYLVSDVVLPKSVTSIGSQAFAYCNNLTSFEMTDSVVTMGQSAFENTSNLNSIKWSNNLKNVPTQTFNGSGLKEFDFSNIETIGDLSFSQTKLESINLINAKSIGFNAFSQIESLKNVVTTSNLKSIGSNAFYSSGVETLTLVEGLETIGSDAFTGIKISNLTIPSTVTKYEGNVCNGCVNLDKLTNNSPSFNLNNMNNGTIAARLRELVMNSGSVSSFATTSTNLNKVYIGANVSAINDFAFQHANIGELTIEEGVTEFGRGAFEGATLPEVVTIPLSVTTIGDQAFNQVSGTRKFIIKGAASIGYNSFATTRYEDEYALEEVEMNNVVSIGQYAFYEQKNLNITVPSTVTSVTSNAFYNVNHVTYNGDLDTSSWGMKSIN